MTEDINYIIAKAEANYLTDTGNERRLKMQMLIDLGYLEKEFKMGMLNNLKMDQAMFEFASDMELSGIFSAEAQKQMEQIYGDTVLAKFLEQATDVDEGIKFSVLPVFGDCNLKTRIFHYRLNLLGLYEGLIASPWSAFSYSALEKASFYAGKPMSETINLLADLEQYTASFLKASGFRHPLVVFNSDSDFTKESIPEYRGAFKRQLKRDLRERVNIFNELDEGLFYRRDSKVNEPYLLQLQKEELNLFILRLIQVHQWMAGNYDGTLDGEFGPLTMESLLEVISHYNGEDRKDVKTEKVLVRIRGNTYLFNAFHFLAKYSEENNWQDRTLETLNILSESISKASEPDKDIFEVHFQAEVDSIKAGENDLFENRDGMFRRIFTGVRAFFKKVFRIAHRLFGWIVDQVRKGINFIRNTIRMIYRFLKEAITHFIRGVKFLLGNLPIVTHNEDDHIAISRFDIDKDVVNLIGIYQQSLLQTHIQTTRQTVYSMNFSLALIAFLYKALKAALMAPIPVAWPLFAVKLVMSFKNVINQYKLVLTI